MRKTKHRRKSNSTAPTSQSKPEPKTESTSQSWGSWLYDGVSSGASLVKSGAGYGASLVSSGAKYGAGAIMEMQEQVGNVLTMAFYGLGEDNDNDEYEDRFDSSTDSDEDDSGTFSGGPVDQLEGQKLDTSTEEIKGELEDGELHTVSSTEELEVKDEMLDTPTSEDLAEKLKDQQLDMNLTPGVDPTGEGKGSGDVDEIKDEIKLEEKPEVLVGDTGDKSTGVSSPVTEGKVQEPDTPKQTPEKGTTTLSGSSRKRGKSKRGRGIIPTDQKVEEDKKQDAPPAMTLAREPRMTQMRDDFFEIAHTFDGRFSEFWRAWDAESAKSISAAPKRLAELQGIVDELVRYKSAITTRRDVVVEFFTNHMENCPDFEETQQFISEEMDESDTLLPDVSKELYACEEAVTDIIGEIDLAVEALAAKKSSDEKTKKANEELNRLRGLWTTSASARGHFVKHKPDTGYETEVEYLTRAEALVNSKASSTILSRKRSDGDKLFFDRSNGDFAIKSKNEKIRTLFRPNRGEDYYHEQ